MYNVKLEFAFSTFHVTARGRPSAWNELSRKSLPHNNYIKSPIIETRKKLKKKETAPGLPCSVTMYHVNTSTRTLTRTGSSENEKFCGEFHRRDTNL